MIEYFEGSVFNTDASTIVNTVNCTGVMGAGVALEFSLRYPDLLEHYESLCKVRQIEIGKIDYFPREDITIINFPTKWHFKYPSKIEWIESGLKNFVETYKKHNIKNVAFPKLGTNNGKLLWSDVKNLMEKYLSPLDIKVYICLDKKQEPEGLEKLMLDKFNGVDLQKISKELKLKQGQIDILNTYKPFNRFWKIGEIEGIGVASYKRIFNYFFKETTKSENVEQLKLF